MINDKILKADGWVYDDKKWVCPNSMQDVKGTYLKTVKDTLFKYIPQWESLDFWNPLKTDDLRTWQIHEVVKSLEEINTIIDKYTKEKVYYDGL